MTCTHSTKPDRSAAQCSLCLGIQCQRQLLITIGEDDQWPDFPVDELSPVEAKRLATSKLGGQISGRKKQAKMRARKLAKRLGLAS